MNLYTLKVKHCGIPVCEIVNLSFSALLVCQSAIDWAWRCAGRKGLSFTMGLSERVNAPAEGFGCFGSGTGKKSAIKKLNQWRDKHEL